MLISRQFALRAWARPVRVYGVTGRPPTDKLKVSVAYRAGFKAVGTLVYAWPDAVEKAQMADRVLRERLDRLGLRFDKILTEFVGAMRRTGRSLAVRAATSQRSSFGWGCGVLPRADVERFTREIAPLVLNGPPSVTGFAGGRPKVEEVVAYWPALIDKRVVHTVVDLCMRQSRERMSRVRLLDIAHARSGDKGDTANVGVIARRPEWYEVLERFLTRDRVARTSPG